MPSPPTDYRPLLLCSLLFGALIVLGIGTNLYEEYYWQQGSAETCATISDFTGENIDNNTVVYYQFKVQGGLR
jgi:hypothetical protein